MGDFCARSVTGLAQTTQNNTKNFTPTSQDRADIAAIEGYLTRLNSFTARFTQRNQDGGSQTGVLYCLRKPGVSGKMQIDYDKPSPITLITYQGMLLYLDRDRDESSYIPLDSSLIGLFAEPTIHFGEKIIVTGLVRHGDLLNLGLRSAENPDFGEAILYFRRAVTAPNACVACRLADYRWQWQPYRCCAQQHGRRIAQSIGFIYLCPAANARSRQAVLRIFP